MPNVIFVLLFVAGLGGCARVVPASYQLEPASGDIILIDGRSVTKAERDGVGVVASFEREEGEFVALDIEIKNHTAHPLLVNPADFRFAALGANQDSLSDPHQTTLALIRPAADPAYEAGRLMVKRSEEVKRLKRAKVLNTLLMVAAIASDASSSGNSRSYSEWVGKRVSHDIAYQAIAVKRAVNYNNFATRMQRYDYEEYRWRELALKANTLAPNESVRGFVYLPKVPDARYVALSYSVPELTSVPLLFSQTLVPRGRTRPRR